ncbi:MAG: 2-amino-4-hydroxy-6-hydroxymethyldihydropteridine diphosphokinase [bacterium]
MNCDHVFVSLGSNVGDRLFYLRAALRKLAQLEDTKIVDHSSVYESEPVGHVKQSDFLNVVVQLSTTHTPDTFLKKIQNIEKKLGRIRIIHWGPRTIDIDILYWGKTKINSYDLQIPHTEVEKRKFVLLPLNEIVPEFRVPPHFLRIRELFTNVPDASRVEVFLPKDEYAIY